jgi:hypothetical protein
MKFKGWFISGLVTVVALGATALSATSGNDEKEITEALKQLRKSPSAPASGWPELEKFQFSLWKSMALDPAATTLVPVKLVPKELFAEELTTDLNQQLEVIKQSEFPKNVKAQAEFEQYLKTVRAILGFRIARNFPQARAIAKRGTLDEHYFKLMKKINGTSVASGSFASNEEALHKIENYLQAVKESKPQVQSQTDAKKSPFTNGNQFIWAALIALIGFAFGITAIRMSPEFFEKFISSNITDKFTDSTANAATHTNQLNYARWLSEFEGLLSKLKATQLTHERRIEEVYKHSEKLSQFASALCADPRIKSEVNLEFRMTNLLRELHQQLDQAGELKSGDRAQIHLTLEHCLKLCDAIESGGVVYKRENQPENGEFKSDSHTG